MSTSAADLAAAWVEALATVAAVVAALWAGYYAKKAFEKEVGRDDERDADRRRAQADKVAGWCTTVEDLASVQRGQDVSGRTRIRRRALADDGAQIRWEYYLRNASDVPIYDVTIRFWLGKAYLGKTTRPLVPPSDEAERYEVPQEFQSSARYEAGDHGTTFLLAITFRDAAERWWSRDSEGVLVEGQIADLIVRMQGRPLP